jgi:xanthine dehydrogenase accessory factor
MPPVAENRVVVRGAGEMASGVIWQLVTSGYEVIALERPDPCFVRRYVCYAEAFYAERATIENVTAALVQSVDEAVKAVSNKLIPLLVDPEARRLADLSPLAVIDGRMLKENIDSSRDMAPVVIGLGPGFVAGQNCHAAVETNRGDDLGRVLYAGHTQRDTGTPSAVNGFTHQRVLRSPGDGKFTSHCRITDMVKVGQGVGEVAGLPIVSEIDGMIRGMLHNGLYVCSGQKVGDVDPRANREDCFRISTKAHTIGRGVLEALTSLKDKSTH